MSSVFAWAGERGGCRWYRVDLPAGELRRRGHEVAVSQVAAGRMLEVMETADTVLAQRLCTMPTSERWWLHALHDEPRYQRWLVDHPGGRAHLLEAFSRLLGHRQRLVLELDDDLLHVPPDNPAHAQYSTPDAQANLRINARLADVVVVSTEPLAEVMRPHAQHVEVIPNAIPAGLLDVAPQRRADGVVTIGWAGSVTHARDWRLVDEHLVRVLRRIRRAELHVIGGMGAAWSRVPAHRIRTTRWIDDVWDYYRAVDFHIGLAPLEDTGFSVCKSAIKALEYASLGIPVIASDVTPYREFVRHGETGFLVRRPEDWGRYLRELVHDEAARIEMGRSARAQASEHTIEKVADRWEQVLCR